MQEPDKELIVRDWLAIERTHLANERTLLAYLRTFIVLCSSGVAVWKLEMLSEIRYLGIILTVISPVFLIAGLVQHYRMRHKIKQYYSQETTD